MGIRRLRGNPAVSIAGERAATDSEVAGSFAGWLQGHLGNTRPVFVSDNPAYDWQWIAGMFDRAGLDNPARCGSADPQAGVWRGTRTRDLSSSEHS